MTSGASTIAAASAATPAGEVAVMAPADGSAAGAVLAGLRADRQAIETAEASKLAGVLLWCQLHITEDPGVAATWGDTPVLLGGEGCPWVAEYTLTELAAALRLSLPSARSLVSDVLELAFRLPRLWERVQGGEVPGWRARRVAERTQVLSVEAAGFVDAQVAPFAERLGVAGVERLVEDAIVRFMPDYAARQRDAAADQRRFDIDHAQVSFAGTSHIEGELDLADAVELEAAISTLAAELKDLGSELPLDARRAQAAGELARRHPTLDLQPVVEPEPVVEPVGTTRHGHGEPDRREQRQRERPRRQVVLYLHLSREAVLSMEGHGNPVLTPGALRDSLDIPGDVHLTVRPVLDLTTNLAATGRFATGLQREQVTLRDTTCVAPYCTRPARHLDLDHIQPWEHPDDPGPPGRTETHNLAALCRHHHRAKTHTAWDYQQVLPGVFLWESPHGLRYLTTAGHTIELE